MEIDNNEAKKLFDEFQKIWTLDRVKNMTLEDYTGIKSDGERNDFTYWIERKLETLGSIWGGSGFKFGIYRRSNTETKEQGSGKIYDENYGWFEEYGKTPSEAFEKVKSLIIKVIEYSQNNNFIEIDKINLWFLYKWKIAFHYQNPNNMKIFCIFAKQKLAEIANNELGTTKLKPYEIYTQILDKLLQNKPYNFNDVFNISKDLWEQYNTKENRNNNSVQNNEVEHKGEKMNDKIKTTPLNQILYGPPGTGKTYNTINKALEILGYGVQDDEKSKIMLDYDRIKQKLQEIVKSEDTKALNLENLDSKSDRELVKLLFDYYCSTEQGQIAFVTFHQSFSYEEFVEGIKPIFVDENGEEVKHSKNMIYKAKNGIFKDICERASYKKYEFLGKEANFQISDTTRVWKISIVAKSEKKIREKILKHCFENNEIRIGWADYKTDEQVSKLGTNDRSSIEQFENASVGDMICVFESGKGIIRGVGVIDSEFYWDDENKDEDLQRYSRVRKVKWLDKNERDIYELSGNLTLKTFYPLNRVNAEKLLDKVKVQKDTKLIVDNTQKPFILIIDEINRGNISKILGELITLIEPSKRIGAEEELRVTLPYSNETFGVPSNLYIIGTMNTADRSIALLDTALRRRFDFVEMMPEPESLKNIWIVKDTEQRDNENLVIPKNRMKELDEYMSEKSNCLYKILDSINNRIEFLLDREHTIGHAFFFEKAKFYQSDEYGEWYELTLESLKEIFIKKIIPLLQEYFYDDYAKIDAVLNGNGMVKDFSKNDLQVNLSDDFVDSDKKIYCITKSSKWNEKNFLRIYDSSVQIDKDE